MHSFKNQFKSVKTPKIIKILISLTALFSILCAINPRIFFIFGLSAFGIQHNLFFQFFTNIFIIPNQSISFSFVFHLIFNLYILWILGVEIISLKGLKHFLYLYIFSSLLSSLTAFLILQYQPITFAGANIPIYALAFCWMMIHKDAKVLVFYSFPLKMKWLVLGLMILNLLSNLSSAYYAYFSSYLTAVIFSYLFSLIVWKLTSPFSFLEKFEKTIIHLKKK